MRSRRLRRIAIVAGLAASFVFAVAVVGALIPPIYTLIPPIY
jgi:hypothetical protein